MRRFQLFIVFFSFTIALSSCRSANKTDFIGDSGEDNVVSTNSQPKDAEVLVNDEYDYNNTGDYTMFINEVCSKNKGCTIMIENKYFDWIELYNPTNEAINLEGFGLSDKKAEPFRFIFPKVKINANGYLIIYADKNADPKDMDENLLANFGISKEGETILLTAPDGTTIDTLVVPIIPTNTTYGRKPDGSNNLFNMTATPGKSNNDAKKISEAP